MSQARNCTPAYNNRGLAWESKKECDKAIADYSEAIRLVPQNARAYSNRGDVWSAKRNYDKAIVDFATRSGSILNPNGPTAAVQPLGGPKGKWIWPSRTRKQRSGSTPSNMLA